MIFDETVLVFRQLIFSHKTLENSSQKKKKKKKSLLFYFLFSRLILISWGTRDTLPDTPSKNSPRYYYY